MERMHFRTALLATGWGTLTVALMSLLNRELNRAYASLTSFGSHHCSHRFHPPLSLTIDMAQGNAYELVGGGDETNQPRMFAYFRTLKPGFPSSSLPLYMHDFRFPTGSNHS